MIEYVSKEDVLRLIDEYKIQSTKVYRDEPNVYSIDLKQLKKDIKSLPVKKL